MKIIFFANTDWYLFNYRMPLAETLRGLDNDLILLSPAGNYSSRIKALGFNWQEVNVSRSGINPINEIKTILRLADFYRREKPDLVHHFTSKCVLYGSIAAHLSGVKRIVNSITGMGYVFTRNDLVTFLLKIFLIPLYKIALRNSRVIFQNQRDMDYFIDSHLVKKSQCALIPGSGVDINKFKPAPYPVGVPLIILPARMLWDKGIQEFVDSAAILKSRGVKARFVLVGTPDRGNPRSIPESQLKIWSESEKIEYWGWHEDMVSVYQQASVVCLPSSYREGLAKGLIEAAACGRALVASDIPGCREVIVDGLNGFLVPPKQVVPLAEAIKKIIIDKRLMERMGKESRIIAENYFSAEKINRETIFEYNKLIIGESAKKLVY